MKAPRAGHLTGAPSSFVGRRRETTAVRRLVSSSRVVTLTGPGGIGKTRLALRVADDSTARFRDGAWLVELGPLSEAKLVEQTIASVLAVPEEPGHPLVATLCARLADKRMLLVLDNCEHLVAATAAVVAELLASCPELRVLATSREALGLDGESIYQVPLMRVPERRSRAAQLVSHDAVRLFRERARLAAPDFEVTDDNAECVLAVCRRMDGLPLGIELAAATLRLVPVEDLAQRLTKDLPLPVPTTRTGDTKHRTIEATIDWTHDLLTDDERRLFRRVSVFAGGFSLEAAESVCGGDDLPAEQVLPVLSRLVEQSLVTVGPGIDGRARYGLLETVRTYAARRLSESSDLMEVGQRFLEYFVRFGEASASRIESREQPAALKGVDEELANIRAALSLAREHGPAAGLRLAGALGFFWHVRAYHTEGREWLHTFTRATSGPETDRLRGLLHAANLAWRQGDYDETLPVLDEALGIAKASDEASLLRAALSMIAFIAASIGETQRAKDASREALDLARASRDRRAVGNALYVCSLAAHDDRARARELVAEALGHLVGATPFEVARSLNQLARSYIELGDLDEAREALHRSLSTRAELADFGGLASDLELFAMLEAESSRPERALTLAGAASALREATGFVLPPRARETLEPRLEAVRRRLGAKVSSYWSQGRALSPDEAVAYALGPPEAAPPRRRQDPVLSKRESQVASLLTEGLTNGQVAERLGISERTVDAHVEHIRNKLGLRTRAQIAAWVTENGAVLGTA